MAKLHDAVIVVDVESTCWEGSPPKGQQSDIIEVGLCLLDLKTLERSEKRALMVQPARSTLSPFCTELTTITAADLEGAGSLADACQTLRRELRSRDRPWASFGDYDRNQFRRNCEGLGVPYPFGPRHLNVKSLLAMALGWDKELGMARALDALGFPLEGTHHRGVDDAWNIARLLGEVFRRTRVS